MSETIILDDATRTVYQSDSGGTPGTAGYWVSQRTVWKAGTPQANQEQVQQAAATAMAANRADITQDNNVVIQAATISSTSGTLTALQLSNAVRLLAQCITTNAGNDVNTKKELNAIIRLVLGQFDATN